jgi:hypothetical protein
MDMVSKYTSAPHSAYDEDTERRNRPLRSPCLAVHRVHNLRILQRTLLKQDTVTLPGWPSRGGIIVLKNATPPDFDILHLDLLDPPLRRNAGQDAEDAFCRALLHLGATWWDSEARRAFVGKLRYGDEEALEAFDADEALGLTRLERGWVKVTWPPHTPGVLCVLSCEKIVVGRAGTERPRPGSYGILSPARTMDQRCTVLQRLGGTMYASIDELQQPTYLKVWEENHKGETGPLLKPEFIEPNIYSGHPDDALGNPH